MQKFLPLRNYKIRRACYLFNIIDPIQIFQWSWARMISFSVFLEDKIMKKHLKNSARLHAPRLESNTCDAHRPYQRMLPTGWLACYTATKIFSMIYWLSIYHAAKLFDTKPRSKNDTIGTHHVWPAGSLFFFGILLPRECKTINLGAMANVSSAANNPGLGGQPIWPIWESYCNFWRRTCLNHDSPPCTE